MLHINRILHPTDLSEPAMHSLHLAHSLARDHGAKLVLLGIVQPPMPSAEVYVPIGEMTGQIEEMKRQLARIAATITDVPVDFNALQGEPGPSIVAVAEDVPADMIVMSTHGRTGLSRLLMGSVAEYVMRHAHCPVLTIKPVGTIRVPADDADAVPAQS